MVRTWKKKCMSNRFAASIFQVLGMLHQCIACMWFVLEYHNTQNNKCLFGPVNLRFNRLWNTIYKSAVGLNKYQFSKVYDTAYLPHQKTIQLWFVDHLYLKWKCITYTAWYETRTWHSRIAENKTLRQKRWSNISHCILSICMQEHSNITFIWSIYFSLYDKVCL
jgi:hypothetical protein